MKVKRLSARTKRLKRKASLIQNRCTSHSEQTDFQGKQDRNARRRQRYETDSDYRESEKTRQRALYEHDDTVSSVITQKGKKCARVCY